MKNYEPEEKACARTYPDHEPGTPARVRGTSSNSIGRGRGMVWGPMDGMIVKEDVARHSVASRILSTTKASDEGIGTGRSSIKGKGFRSNGADNFSQGSRNGEWVYWNRTERGGNKRFRDGLSCSSTGNVDQILAVVAVLRRCPKRCHHGGHHTRH